jgi:hypothetical protein
VNGQQLLALGCLSKKPKSDTWPANHLPAAGYGISRLCCINTQSLTLTTPSMSLP